MLSSVGGRGPAGLYVGTILGKLKAIEENLDTIVDAAGEAADRLVEGGNLYAASDEGGFISEACGRAGGMMMIRSAPAPSEVNQKDVVLAGTLNLKPEEQGDQIRRMREEGALVILFGSAESPVRAQADFFIDNFLPLGTAPLISLRGERICPAGGVGNIAAMWTFTAELVAACTRGGKMPTMWQSVVIQTSRERNARYREKAFHDDLEIAPIPSGEKGREYLADLRRCFEGIRDTQLGFFEEAGRLAADALRSGHKVWCVTVGHHLPSQKGIPGDPGLFDTGSLGEMENAFRAGDVFLYVGYYHYPEPELNAVRGAGLKSVWVHGGRETTQIDPQPGEIHIDPYWTYGDASVEIPGYDVRILPPSGVVQTAALWILVGETAQAMGAKGCG